MKHTTKSITSSIIGILSLIIAVITSLLLVSPLNFGGSSPDTGEADWGNNTGTYDFQSGAYNSTWADDNIYFAIGRDSGETANASQVLSFNISKLSTNSSLTITGINVSLKYCHARNIGDACTGTNSTKPEGKKPQGSSGSLKMWIYNFSGSKWVGIGNITATTQSDETFTFGGVPIKYNNNNYSSFISASGFVNISFDFIWWDSGKSTFHNDYTNLTITYDVVPTVSLNSPQNNSFLDPSNITFNCSFSNDNQNVNITLYHNFNGTFSPNLTAQSSGTDNYTMFTLTNLPETQNGLWNCLVYDGVHSVFAPSNYSIDTTYLNLSIGSCSPSVGTTTTGTVNSPMVCNSTITDNIEVSSVIVNITLPNGSIYQIENANINNNNSNTYSFNFTNTYTKGNYTFVWWANDSVNNIKSAQSSFVINNVMPNITLVSPSNNTERSDNANEFVFYYIDDNTNIACNLTINSTLSAQNTSTLNNTNTSFLFNLTDGEYNWRVTCIDIYNAIAYSHTYTLIVDTIPEEQSSPGNSGGGGGGGGSSSKSSNEGSNSDNPPTATEEQTSSEITETNEIPKEEGKEGSVKEIVKEPPKAEEAKNSKGIPTIPNLIGFSIFTLGVEEFNSIMLSFKEIRDVFGRGYDQTTSGIIGLAIGGVFKSKIFFASALGVFAIVGAVRTRKYILVRKHKNSVIYCIEKRFEREQESILENPLL